MNKDEYIELANKQQPDKEECVGQAAGYLSHPVNKQGVIIVPVEYIYRCCVRGGGGRPWDPRTVTATCPNRRSSAAQQQDKTAGASALPLTSAGERSSMQQRLHARTMCCSTVSWSGLDASANEALIIPVSACRSRA